ncbi:MAG: glycosyltransferase [Rhodospirillaceae bacterium]
MKVFHLLSGEPYGGVERQLERLAAVLEKDGAGQRVLMREDAARAQRLAAIGAIPIEMPFPGRFAFMDRRRINTAIRKFAPDVVISWTPDMAPMVEKGSFVHVGRLGSEPDLAAFTQCDRLFTPAQARADAAINAINAGWSAEKVKVLAHLPRPDEAAAASVSRKTYYTPPTAKLVVTALRLTKASGLDVLLDAVARLSGYYLWILGDGADRAELEQLAHDKGVKPRVRFMGWQNDVTPFLAAADVFVTPSRKEDVADSVLEAWSMGAPVIAADSLGPGLLLRHQENGMLVPVGDVVSTAEAIKWICQDKALATRLGEAGRAAFNAGFTPAKITPEYLAYFNGLAAASAPTLI